MKWLLVIIVVQFLTISSQSIDWFNFNSFESRIKNVISRFDRTENVLLKKNEPEVNMNASELITSKGYPCQEFSIPTRDGFLLGVQRIPYGKRNRNMKNRPVVFLQHGLLTTSTNWLTNLEDQSFAYILADSGYDVWLGNFRGNTYSRKHIKLSTKTDEFWDWSWNEMAAYDLPAMIDFALYKSNQQQLYYVGHSQGSLTAFTQLSRDKEFASKIKLMVGLGPVAWLNTMKSPLKYLSYFAPEIDDFFKLFGVRDFLPNDKLSKFLARFVCDGSTKIFCEGFIFLISGFDRKQLNSTRLPIYLAHTPAGTSVKNIMHFAQMYQEQNYQAYDYGSSRMNYHHYGQAKPPAFHPENITVPVALFAGQKDWLSDPEDVLLLKAKLKNLVHYSMLPDWDHLDFVWAKDANTVVYEKVIKLFETFDKK